MNRLFVVLAATAIVLTVAVVGIRARRSVPNAEPASSAAAQPLPTRTSQAPDPVKPGTPEELGRSAHAVKVDTYLHLYCRALAARNEEKAERYRNLLLKDRKTALRLADGLLAQAKADTDRVAIQTAIESLRR